MIQRLAQEVNPPYIDDDLFKRSYDDQVKTSTLYTQSDVVAFDAFRAHPTAEKAHMRMLSVGCGTGNFDRTLIRNLLAEGWRLTFHGVDPCKGAVEEFQKHVEETELLPRADYQFHDCAFEDFHSDERYDLVTFGHVVYYIKDLNAILLKARTFLNGPHARVHVLVTRLCDVNIPFTDVMLHFQNVKVSYSAEVQDVLTRNGVPFSMRDCGGFQNVVALFEEEKREEMVRDGRLPEGTSVSQDVDLFLAFLTHINPRKLDIKDRELLEGWFIERSTDEFGIPHPGDLISYF
jgi:SAM-dependent methyltransferase